jgi:hypothetical protein
MRHPAAVLNDVQEADRERFRYLSSKHGRGSFFRELVPGEFDMERLPLLPPPFRYATLVGQLQRDGKKICRRVVAVCTDKLPKPF